MLLSGISTCFQVVSQSLGQIAHVLLTHPPLASNKSPRRDLWIQLARLACIRHAASVRPEPGSNSQFENWALFNLLQIICLRIDFAYLFGSNNIWPAHCETLFSFQSTNLRLSDATFYILLACLILVNKFLIFSFSCLRQIPSSPRQQILVYSLFLKGQISLFIRFIIDTAGRVVTSAAWYSFAFVFAYGGKSFSLRRIVRIIVILPGEKR